MRERKGDEGHERFVADGGCVALVVAGGSAKAAADLVEQLGGTVVGYLFILEIPGLDGRQKLGGVPVSILLEDA